ncbi:MAG: hypothetical protein GF418_11390 [Chitinivibrionales bacterium]|nr:hypothetical protein [Chitinivibrionales bacterium]MBD3396219.1 hypothetical protein [Chitinivibrionales bacterium]
MCFPPPTLELDTLADGIVEVSEYDALDSLVSVDTVTRQELLDEMVALYEDNEYCYLGTIDTVITDGNILIMPMSASGEEKIEPIEPIPGDYRIDSVHVVVKHVFKGEVSESEFWFLDSVLNAIALDATQVSYGFSRYSLLQGASFVLFGDNAYDLRASTVLPPRPCQPDPQGYMVSDENMISKEPNASVGDGGYPGIELTLDDFTDALLLPTKARLCREKCPAGTDAHGNAVRVDLVRGVVGLDAAAAAYNGLSLYDARGALVRRAGAAQTAQIRLDGLPAGRYIARAEAGDVSVTKIFTVRP